MRMLLWTGTACTCPNVYIGTITYHSQSVWSVPSTDPSWALMLMMAAELVLLHSVLAVDVPVPIWGG